MINRKLLFVFSLLLLAFKSYSQENLYITNLPAQLVINEGSSKTFQFDAAIAKVVSRKADVATFSINGNQLTLNGQKAGRTGLKITTADNKNLFIGLRINNADGSIPALPNYLAIGSVSEDIDGDLDFWKDIDTDLTNKQMDIRYIYINGGVSALGNGWKTWGGDRVGKYCEESIRLGLVPFFVYYNIPDGGESYETDLNHTRDVEYMKGYFEDMDYFFKRIETKLNGDLYGMILEPDFLGYLQQLGVIHGESEDPALIKTAVADNVIAKDAGTIKTLVERINKTVNQKKLEGHKIIFGWQVNLWSYGTRPDGGSVQGSKGVLRRTDDLGFDAGRELIKEAAEATGTFAMKAGILSYGADFVSIDKYGLDAMGYENKSNPYESTWFFNNDHWNNYLHYVNNLHITTGKPIVLWQLPVGRINSSESTSSYTNQKFPDLPNTNTKYEDSTPDYFFGDTFTANTAERLNYFAQNKYNDPKLSVNGNKITWKGHMKEAKEAGVVIALFGAGVGSSTDGVGSPPTEDYFWIQKVQEYYQSVVTIDKPFDGNNLACDNGCPPVIILQEPSSADKVYEVYEGDSISLWVKINDLNGTVASVKIEIDGMILPYKMMQNIFTIKYSPKSFGTHLLKITATDNENNTSVREVSFIVKEYNPLACRIPVWEAKVYATTTQVSYGGFVYENQWYASETDEPVIAEVWKKTAPCGDVNLLIDTCKNEWKNNSYDANSKVSHNGFLWTNTYYAAASDEPGVSEVWKKQRVCTGIDVMINVKGNMSFGNVGIGGFVTRDLTIVNEGNSDLNVTSLVFPDGYSGSWSGTIPDGESQVVVINFNPQEQKNYSGLIKVISNATSGHNTLPVNGNGILITGLKEKTENNLTIFPNPAKDELNILSDFSIKYVSLVNMTGEQCYHEKTEELNNLRIKLDDRFSPGVYVMTIVTKSSCSKHKIIISR